MLRKTTGLAIACVMVTIIAMQYPALLFCHCQKSITLSESICKATKAISTQEAPQEGCCSSQQTTTDIDCTTPHAPKECLVGLTLDLGNYLALNHFHFTIDVDEAHSIAYHSPLLKLRSAETLWTIDRGGTVAPFSPPPQMPLYTRHSTFLL